MLAVDVKQPLVKRIIVMQSNCVKARNLKLYVVVILKDVNLQKKAYIYIYIKSILKKYFQEQGECHECIRRERD